MANRPPSGGGNAHQRRTANRDQTQESRIKLPIPAEKPKESKVRDYVFAALALIAEYAALRYAPALVWVATFLLWLAVLDYTRDWRTLRKRVPYRWMFRVAAAVILVAITHELLDRFPLSPPNGKLEVKDASEWRRLEDWQRVKLVALLSRFAGAKVAIVAASGMDTALYAQEIRQTFIDSHWNVWGIWPAPQSQQVTDIEVSVSNQLPASPEGLTVAGAFEFVSLKARRGVILDGHVPTSTVIVWVGPKSPDLYTPNDYPPLTTRELNFPPDFVKPRAAEDTVTLPPAAGRSVSDIPQSSVGILAQGSIPGSEIKRTGELNSVHIKDSPGSAISFGQQGGITAGTVTFGPPPPVFRFTEEVVTEFSQSNGKSMKIHVTTDRSITGAMIAITFSGPVDCSGIPNLTNSGHTNIGCGTGLDDNGRAIPNVLGIVINIPSVFRPDQELVVSVNSKIDVHVLKVGTLTLSKPQ